MPGPDPSVAAVRVAVRDCLADLPAAARVLVACSGGPDSLALAAATAHVARKQALLAGAVVVDHQWWAGSHDVARQAQAACRALGLDPVDLVRVDASVRPGEGGPEAVARRARYAAFESAAGRHGAAAVLLGHTLADQAETVLLGLLRGSGARSLAGMPARRGVFRRPLLALSRAQTVAACQAQGLRPWSDPANDDPAYARSRLRPALRQVRQILAEGLGDSSSAGADLDAALARTADLLREDADALDDAAEHLMERAIVPYPPYPPDPNEPAGPLPSGRLTALTLEVAVLRSAPDAVRRRALLAALREAGSPAGSLGRRHVLAVDALVSTWHGQGPVHLPGRVEASRACGRLCLTRPAIVTVGEGTSAHEE